MRWVGTALIALTPIAACGIEPGPPPGAGVGDAGPAPIVLADGAVVPACPTPCKTGEVCADGVCQKNCPPPTSACDAVCIDLGSTHAHCGACDVSCTPAEYCSGGKCILPGCGNGIQDPGETGVDCGGLCSATKKCPPGAGCSFPADCQNGDCVNKVCGGVATGTPASCKAIKTSSPAAADGRYTIDTDGAGASPPFEVFCDMTTAGGGWTVLPLLFNDAAMWSITQTGTACTTIGKKTNTGDFELYLSSSPGGYHSTVFKFVPPLVVTEARLVGFQLSPSGTCNSMDFAVGTSDVSSANSLEAWYFADANPSTSRGAVFATTADCKSPYVLSPGVGSVPPQCGRDGNLGAAPTPLDLSVTYSTPAPLFQMVVVQGCGSGICDPLTNGERFNVTIPADGDGIWRKGIAVR